VERGARLGHASSGNNPCKHATRWTFYKRGERVVRADGHVPLSPPAA
jgi:hypothetical protein